jgi:carboxylesterase
MSDWSNRFHGMSDLPADAAEYAHLDPALVAGTPLRLSMVGGALLVISAMFPWFTAGAITTEPLQGRAIVALLLGVAVLTAGVLFERSTLVWQLATGVSAVTGVALAIASSIAPPRALGPSAGVAFGLAGALLAGLGLFAARWRRHWAPNATASAPADPDANPPAASSTVRRVARIAGIVGAVAIGFLLLWPAAEPTLATQPDPTTTHEEAVERFEQMTADEPGVVYEPCESRLLTHGERAEVAVVLFHGLTNCPKQFVEFGTELFDAGANVLILRAPDHGLANSDGTEIGSVANIDDLTAQQLRNYADDAVDVATGLGEEVRVLGLSMGGVIAAWTAQERADVDRVVAVAPAISIPYTAAALTQVFRNVFDKLPNISLPSSGTKLDHAYAGETTKGLDATFAMAAHVADSAYVEPPVAGDVVIVLNPDDDQVDATYLAEFADAWSTTGGPVALYRFPAVGLRHDVIDLDQPDSRPELVYPILATLLDGGRP